MSCACRPRRAGACTGWAGLYWEKTRDKNSGSTYYMPGLRYDGPAFQYYNAYNGTAPGSTSLPPGDVVRIHTRSDYLQQTEFANINFDITDKLNIEAGAVHFHSDFKYYSPYGQFAYVADQPSPERGLLAQVEQQVRLQLQVQQGRHAVRGLLAGLPRRRLQLRLPECLLQGQRSAAAATLRTR